MGLLDQHNPIAASWKVAIKTSDPILGAGLFCAMVAAGLVQFVMIGLIGVILFPAALALLVTAGIMALPSDPGSPWRRRVGLVIYLLGVFMLFFFAGEFSLKAYDSFKENRNIAGLNWLSVIGAAVGVACVVGLGLRLRANWSWLRCGIWGTIAAIVLPGSLFIFWTLAPMLPLTA